MNIDKYIQAIKDDEKRNKKILHLTANESQLSETARTFLGSKLSERYYFGLGKNNIVDFEPFTALSLDGVAHLIQKAEQAAKEMLGASIVNFSCLSGIHAMMCAILSCTSAGETVMTVPLEFGGHFAIPGILERVGRKNIFASYDLKNMKFDAKKIAKDYHHTKASAFYMDVSYYLNPHNLKEIREALGEKAIIIYDASHTMGLILGQQFQAPLQEGANVICANTHKTLPGPQKGMIAFRDKKFGEKANDIINQSLYSSPHTHHMIALATTILELKEFGQEYAKQVILNSNALGKALETLGYSVRKANTGRYSENHQVHVFIDSKGNRLDLFKKLLDNNISTNFDKPLGNRLFIRLGTQEVTRRGMKEKEMNIIAKFIHQSFKGKDIKNKVVLFNKLFRKIHYSFDG